MFGKKHKRISLIDVRLVSIKTSAKRQTNEKLKTFIYAPAQPYVNLTLFVKIRSIDMGKE